MNLGELIEAFRDESDDKARDLNGSRNDVFATDDTLIRFANEAQVEACRRAFLLGDSTSPMCTITYAANDASVPLDGKILEIRWAADPSGQQLSILKPGGCIHPPPGWQHDPLRAAPQSLILGIDTGRAHLYPRPKDAGTLHLTVYRLPLERMAVDDDVPEIRDEWHRGLVDWMLYRAYSRRDGDRHDPRLAAEALARFEAEFGRGHGARNEEWSRNAPVHSLPPIA